MEELIISIIEEINKTMPQLSLVDEDYGQLDAIDDENKDMYPLTYPAVLIDASSCQWNNLSELKQEGECTVVVKLIIDCYDDTHRNSKTIDRIMQREELRKALHNTLQGFRPNNDGALIRTSSRYTTINHGIKLYESTYTCRVSEAIQQKRRVQKSSISFDVNV